MDSRSAQARKYARVVGSPGEWARFAGLVRALWPLFLIAAAFGYLLRETLPVPRLGPTAAGFLFLMLAGGLAWAAALKGKRLELFMKGARGEEWVAHELAFLPAPYVVFHGLHVEKRGFLAQHGDYDHVVVGPSGVFVVETKNWSGQITIQDGRILYNGLKPDRSPLDQVKAAVTELRRRLGKTLKSPPAVRPIICFAAGQIAGGRQGIAGAMLCDIANLNFVIQESHDETLPEATQVEIAAFLQDLSGADAVGVSR